VHGRLGWFAIMPGTSKFRKKELGQRLVEFSSMMVNSVYKRIPPLQVI